MTGGRSPDEPLVLHLRGRDALCGKRIPAGAEAWWSSRPTNTFVYCGSHRLTTITSAPRIPDWNEAP